MDDIIYQSNNDTTIPINLYKKDEPGPGSYEVDGQFEISKALSKARSGLLN